ncbi:redoxin domain-containing protein [Rheinheimera salexigens]|uniref:Thioredoxin peroxidase n=1 Tax=Rheinheimera salexigens TaxID=1628148 RepID=A0A1E7Q626_9GAMM|nr:redoxin domain-containing protein [Rheinheimera salexigens]OEY69596.1 thioredoxin peroxidase [Rheinheimera salexigens]
MQNTKLSAGEKFPLIQLTNSTGTKVNLVNAQQSENATGRWSLIIIYRGYHCPICLKYLNNLETYSKRLQALQIDLSVASADTPEQLNKMKEKGLQITCPILTGLTLAQMKLLGLYISDPMNESETDHPFPEPGLFLINPDGETIMIDIANAPFIRPDLEQLVSGLEFSFSKNYPVRGTHPY